MEGTLTGGKKVTASNNVIVSYPISSSVTPSKTTTFYDYISLKATFSGSVRISMLTGSNYSSAKAIIIINIIRNNEVVYTTGEMQGGTSSGLTLSNDISDIKHGDIINIKLGTNYPNKTVSISNFSMGGDLA